MIITATHLTSVAGTLIIPSRTIILAKPYTYAHITMTLGIFLLRISETEAATHRIKNPMIAITSYQTLLN